MIWKKPTVNEITPEAYDEVSNLKHIEQCGRICYDSLNKMTEWSYGDFYQMIVPKTKYNPDESCDFHLSVLEHATIYLHIKPRAEKELWLIDFFIHNPYSKVNENAPMGGGIRRTEHAYNMDGPYMGTDYYITTNWRVLFENEAKMVKAMGLEDSIFDFIYPYRTITPDNCYATRRTFVVETGIDITREFNRHRCLSISESSTRWIDPTLPNHGGQVPFNDFKTEDHTWLFVDAYKGAEENYKVIRRVGFKPQIARKVLPLGTGSTVVYTAFEEDWNKVMRLRSKKAGAKGVHPDAIIIADMIYDHLNA
jgi:thymidylate synthase ThyX